MKATLRMLRAITAVIALTMGALLLLPSATFSMFAFVTVISTPRALLSLPPTDYLQLFASVAAIPVYVFGLIKKMPELALTLVQFHYKPAFEPAPGYAMQWLSEPNVIEGVTLAYHDMMDGRNRAYSLLGWTKQNELYFEERYEGQEPHTLMYLPAGKLGEASFVPSALSEGKCPNLNPFAFVSDPQGRLADGSPVSLADLYMRSYKFSPDCSMLAVVSEAVYGPQDVMILRQEK